MPIYEFTCDDCGAKHEILMSRAAEPPPCSECDSEALQKVFSVFATSSPDCASERTCENLEGGPPAGCPNAGKCRLGA